MQERIQQLERRLLSFSAQSDYEISDIKAQIQVLKQQLEAQQYTQPIAPEPIHVSVPLPIVSVAKPTPVKTDESARLESPKQPVEAAHPPTPMPSIKPQALLPYKDQLKVEKALERPQAKAKPEAAKRAERKPGDKVVTVESKSISEILLASELPFGSAIAKLYRLYQDYQNQGKAAIFMLTLTGCLAMTFGFGYLLQYGFNHMLSDGGKVIAGYGLSLMVAAFGALICVKKPKFREYGSSIIGLGMIFANLTCYLAGMYLDSINVTLTMTSAIAIAALSSSLALKFETKTVALIGLVGGLLSPVVLGLEQMPGHWFAAFVVLTSIANVHLSRRIDWPRLSQIAFVVATAVMTYCGINTQPDLAMMAILSAFFICFAYALMFDGVTLKSNFSNTTITIFVANIFFWLYSNFDGVYAQSISSTTSACLMLAAAALFAVISHWLKLAKSQIGALLYMAIALFVGSSAFVMLPVEASNFVWTIEGIALLVIGFNYRSKAIRLEGLVVFGIALLGLIYHMTGNLQSPQYSPLQSWLYLGAIAATSLATVKILAYFDSLTTSFEQTTKAVLSDILTACGVVAVLLASYQINPSFTLLGAPVAMAWTLYRSVQLNSRIALGMFWLCFALIVVQIALSASEVQSIRFSEQSLAGKIARIEFVILGFTLKSLLQRHFTPKSTCVDFARMLRLAMFIWLPMAFLPRVFRHGAEFLAPALWLSTLFSYLIDKKLDHWVVKRQVGILFAIATALTTFTFIGYDTLHGVIAAVAAIGFIVVFTLVEKTFKAEVFDTHPLAKLSTWSVYVCAWLTFCATGFMFENLALALGSVLIYIALVFRFAEHMAFVQKQVLWLHALGNLFAWIVLALALTDPLDLGHSAPATIIAFAFILMPVVIKSQVMDIIKYKLTKKGNDALYLKLNIATVMAYLGLTNVLFGDPLMVSSTLLLLCHGIVLLYLALYKHKSMLNKPAAILLGSAALKLILLDMLAYSVTHKIIALMGCGGLLLLAAYQFQRIGEAKQT